MRLPEIKIKLVAWDVTTTNTADLLHKIATPASSEPLRWAKSIQWRTSSNGGRCCFIVCSWVVAAAVLTGCKLYRLRRSDYSPPPVYSSFSNKSRILFIVSSTTEVITSITLFFSDLSVGVATGVGDSTAVGADVGCDVGVGFGVEPEDIVSIGHISS